MELIVVLTSVGLAGAALLRRSRWPRRSNEAGQGVLEVVLVTAGLSGLAVIAVGIIGAKVTDAANRITIDVPTMSEPGGDPGAIDPGASESGGDVPSDEGE